MATRKTAITTEPEDGFAPMEIDVSQWEVVVQSDGQPIDWDEVDSIEAIYHGTRNVTPPDGEEFQVATFTNLRTGERCWTSPGYILSRALEQLHPEDHILIINRGTVPMSSGRNPMRTFDIYRHKS